MASKPPAERSGKLSRARIIEIAFEHFATYGYRGASLAKIAAEVGISQPGLLYHFPTKTALFMGVLKARDLHDLELVELHTEDLEDLDFLKMLDYFELVVEHNARNRNMVQLAHLIAAEAGNLEHPAREWVVERMTAFRSLCTSAIAKSVERGDIRADADPSEVATMLIAASEGLENQWLIEPSIDLAGSFKVFLAMLRRDLQAGQPPT
ncbi:MULTISPECIES: TetR/AcrR family transcriptional regulator [unclassified Nocardioides]|uniref:TetR/AcrR family transcriptional regulator n=1 Tax=unclassified Nocardioides TaxID=2615069 RepID=UPI0006F2FEF2|nr:MULTISPECIES: TetR/AcrR family transcriptional regulator [unclassified Nocardioides]KRA38497.1 hypothetical protein ASD81_07695 [Nocardioides sp. Root614]KRA92457.1 hypothetical protein ASD84_07960 [Nocardioides sp. Root682]